MRGAMAHQSAAGEGGQSSFAVADLGPKFGPKGPPRSHGIEGEGRGVRLRPRATPRQRRSILSSSTLSAAWLLGLVRSAASHRTTGQALGRKREKVPTRVGAANRPGPLEDLGPYLPPPRLTADSDDLARVYRFDLAQDSEMISPNPSDLMSPGARGVLAVYFWHRRSRVVNLESRFAGLVFLRLLLWACGQRACVVQAQRHVHSATGSGLSAGFATISSARFNN